MWDLAPTQWRPQMIFTNANHQINLSVSLKFISSITFLENFHTFNTRLEWRLSRKYTLFMKINLNKLNLFGAHAFAIQRPCETRISKYTPTQASLIADRTAHVELCALAFLYNKDSYIHASTQNM